MPYRLATSQYMHHDLDTRDIVAYAEAEINTFFDLFPGWGRGTGEKDKNVRVRSTLAVKSANRISSAYYDVSF